MSLSFFLLFTVTFAVEYSLAINGNISKACLQCICEASSGCDVDLNCQSGSKGGKQVCGPYKLTKSYWQNGGRLLGNFEYCANDRSCAENTIENYMKLHAHDCNNDGQINCLDYAALHIAPYSEICHEKWIFKTKLWSNFERTQCFLLYRQPLPSSKSKPSSSSSSSSTAFSSFNVLNVTKSVTGLHGSKTNINQQKQVTQFLLRPPAYNAKRRQQQTKVKQEALQQQQQQQQQVQFENQQKKQEEQVKEDETKMELRPIKSAIGIQQEWKEQIKDDLDESKAEPDSDKGQKKEKQSQTQTNKEKPDRQEKEQQAQVDLKQQQQNEPNPSEITDPSDLPNEKKLIEKDAEQRFKLFWSSGIPNNLKRRFDDGLDLDNSQGHSFVLNTAPVRKAVIEIKDLILESPLPSPSLSINSAQSTGVRVEQLPAKPSDFFATVTQKDLRIKNLTAGVTDECISCIRSASNYPNLSECKSNATKCGPFNIDRKYWFDGGHLGYRGSKNDFFRCAVNVNCAEATVRLFLSKNGVDCNQDGVIDCIDHAIIHQNGKDKCTDEAIFDTDYWMKFISCYGFGNR